MTQTCLPTDGAEGLALGIFNRLAPLGKLMEETMALAQQIVAKPPHAMIRLKENMNNAVLESGFLPALDAEGVNLSTHLATAEGKLEAREMQSKLSIRRKKK